MKKIIGLFAATAATATLLVGCGNSTPKVETVNDTINYAFGAANGAGIRQYVLGDTLSAADTKLFCKGFKEAFADTKHHERLEMEGFRMGNSMRQETTSGFLFGDSSLVINNDLLMTTFKDAIKGKYAMSPEIAMQRFQSIMSTSLSTGMPVGATAEQADSISMFFGLINGNGARKFLLLADTTDADIKRFLAGIDKGLKATDADKWYLEGIQIGSTMDQQLSMNKYLLNDTTIAVSRQLIELGLLDVCTASDKAIMTGEDAQKYITTMLEARSAEKNKNFAAKGEAFLAANATKEGVITTESGLQYKVVTMGKGAKPTATDKVRVHYHGTLIDGTVFDSSVERGEPLEFPLNAVIKGWTEGLQLMPVGSKFILYIPYQLAYGERSQGDKIGPCEALIFEVELLDIVK